MLVIFWINLVKIEIVWLLEKRDLHSFWDGGSKKQVVGPGTGSRVVFFFFKKKEEMPRRVCFPCECVGFPVHGQGHEYGHNRAFHPCLCFCCILYSSLQWVVWFLMVSMIAVTRTCWGTSCRHLAAASLQVLPCQLELCHRFGSCWSLSCFLVVLLDYILLIWKLLLCVVTSFEFVENMNRRNMNQQLLRYIIVLLTYTLQVPKNVEYLLLTTTELNIC